MSSVSISRISSMSTSIASVCGKRARWSRGRMKIRKGHKLKLHATTTEIETNFTTYSIHTYGWVVQLLQFVVQPHLDGEPLPDEAHLVRAVLGREEFLPPLLHLALLGEVDPQAGAARRTLAVVHGLNAALHLRWCSVVPFRRLGPGQSSEKK